MVVHVNTFGASGFYEGYTDASYNCPCTDSGRFASPSFVGLNYCYESQIFYNVSFSVY